MSDITERVQRIIEEKLGVDASEVKPLKEYNGLLKKNWVLMHQKLNQKPPLRMIWVLTLWTL